MIGLDLDGTALNGEGHFSGRVRDAIAKAGRQTEAGLFCGTFIEIATRHGIDVPVNRMFCERFM